MFIAGLFIPETNRILLINYTLIKKNNELKSLPFGDEKARVCLKYVELMVWDRVVE